MTDEGSRLDRIEALVERNSQQIGELTDKQDRFQRALNGVVEILGMTATQLNELTERVNSLAAATERHDRILDYLLERDGEQPQG